jgi:Glycosyl hydrolases family 28
MKRRALVEVAGRSLGLLTISAAVAQAQSARAAAGQPRDSFPVYNVVQFDARPDGIALNTEALQRAIDAASRAGGGVVYFPPGTYATGTVTLKTNVTLYLEAGATLLGSSRQADYPHRCLLYAEGAANIAICGRGVVDGNCHSIWTRAAAPVRPGWPGWVVGSWRPSAMLIFSNCQNVLLEGITFQNSPAWTLHPILCDNLVVRGISILNLLNEDRGPNADGIDPDCCTNVRISDCYLQCGDDAIVLKSGERPGGSGVCRDVTVTNCVIATNETALKIGSETNGEFRNIAFSNCVVRDAGCGVGLWMRDGGRIDGWTVDNISLTLSNGGIPIYLWAYPRSRLPERGASPPAEKPSGTVRNVTISNVLAEADGGIFISGEEAKHIEGVTLDNIRIRMRGATKKPMSADPPYPFAVWGHRQAPYDIFCRYVDDLKLRNIQLTWNTPEQSEWGSAIRCRHVRRVEIDGFVGRQAGGSDAPAISLLDTKDAFIHNCCAPEGTGVFLKVGEGTEHVTVLNNDLSRAGQVLQRDSGIELKEIFLSGNREPNG